MRLKHVARVGYGLGQPPRLSDAGIPILRATNIMRGKFASSGLIFAAKDDLPIHRAPLLREGEILVVRSGAYTGDSALVTNSWAGCSPGYDLRVSPVSAHPAYVAYCLLSTAVLDQIHLARTRAAQPHLNAEDLGDLNILIPALNEQRRIADFLDLEMSRIDALRECRLAQASSLSELELARIGEELAGVDVGADRIETGWHWLPSIPGAWRAGPVYAYFNVQLGKMLNVERASGTCQQPYLRNANIHWYEIDTEDLATMTFEPYEKLRYGVQTGDLLVCEGGAGVAESAVWDGRISACFYQKSLHRVRSLSHLPVEWLMYWLRFARAAGVFDADGNLATIPHLTSEQLADYRIPIPKDGHRRVAKLNLEIAAIRKTRIELASANALLSERRQALITAAVTGQIDVTTARGLSSAGGTAV